MSKRRPVAKSFRETKAGKNFEIKTQPVREKKINISRRDEEIFNRLWRQQMPESRIKTAMKQYKDHWEGYDVMTYDELKEQFRYEVLQQAHLRKHTIKHQFKSFATSGLFMSAEERYARNNIIGMRRYAPDEVAQVERILGCAMENSNPEFLNDNVFQYSGPHGTVRINAVYGISGNARLGQSAAYIIEVV